MGVGQAAYLGFDQLAVDAVAAQQRFRRAVLHQAALLQHQDAIEIAHRRQAMRNGQDGASAHEATERLANQLF